MEISTVSKIQALPCSEGGGIYKNIIIGFMVEGLNSFQGITYSKSIGKFSNAQGHITPK